ncbi:hypothetical protein PHMEG_00034128 [Phytophthora megakarya]|uniref:Uncharacterized protein n=1 Tax=Phytophthora megakarya TaxID=4795 RepID=A0A225URP7_9STRA|nr:hypothetical protein PHMEG_00034128 [Phytophthora megakarya]
MECRRELHRVKMVAFRQKKKELKDRIQNEHRRLEHEMKQHISNFRNEAAKCTKISTHDQQFRLRAIIEEKEALLQQNAALREEIKRRETFTQMIGSEDYHQPKPESSKAQIHHGDVGCWVHFTNGAPAFIFYPFSAEEAHAIRDPMSFEFDNCFDGIPTKGSLFGWNVYHELNFRENRPTKSVSSRMRFTKRIEVSYEKAYNHEQDLRPLLLTPIDWSCNNINNVNTHVLQELGNNTCITFHSIPGSTNLHYMFLARTTQWRLKSGKRRMGFSMMATDSQKNNRMRNTMGQNDVEWLTEGWAYFMITEVDANTIDVVYDHCVDCDNQIHADKFFILLAQFIYRWEQEVLPSKLLIN